MQGIGTNWRGKLTERVKENGVKTLVIKIVVCVLILAFLVAADQVTKLVFRNLNQSGWNKTVVIDDFFYFEYAFNTGAAWSFLSGKTWGQTFFKVLTSIALIVFIAYLVFVITGKYKTLLLGTVLVISGTLGNFIDRLAMNGVTDFISLYFGSYHFPIFNLADTFLTVGVIVVIVHYFFLDDKAVFKKNAEKNISDK